MNKKNISIKKKINKLTYNQKFEIYNILVRNNSKFSENKNGIFFNLKYLDKETILLIETFLDYSEDINTHEEKKSNNLQSLETEYSNYKNLKSTSSKNDSIKKNIDSSVHNEEEFILYDIHNEEYTKDLKKNIKLDILQISNQDEEEEPDEDEDVADEDNNDGDQEVDNEHILDDDDDEDEDEEEEDKDIIMIEEELENDDDEEMYEDEDKKKFIFKNYINKLNLQSKEILPKSASFNSINKHSYKNYNHSLNSQSLSGSTYKIYNICKNITKYNDYSNYNINNNELILE